MTCNGCRNMVEKKLNEIDEVEKAIVILKNGTAQIESLKHIDFEVLENKIKELGGQYQIYTEGETIFQNLRLTVFQILHPSSIYVLCLRRKRKNIY